VSKLQSSLVALAAALITIVQAAPAQALLSRTCVSAAKGNDVNASNSCDCSTPCRSFQVAHDNTSDQGEVMVLDAGGYGALTITKSISIANDGAGEASMLVSGGGAGITVNASNATGYVNLRGITIQGVSGGTSTGLRFNSGVALTVSNCVIRNHTGNGIEFLSTASSQLSVSNTLVSDNGGNGILLQPAVAGTVKAAFNRVESYNNSKAGFSANANGANLTIKAAAVESVAANNGGAGFASSVLGSNTSNINFFVIRSVASNNASGILSSTLILSTIWVGNSVITENTVGFDIPIGQGTIKSYGDNYLDGNGMDAPFGFTSATRR